MELGHDARIIDPRFVAPYRHSGRSGKNDRNDAQAICEAVSRPTMRFVPIKNPQQQAVLTIHRVRSGYVVEHTRVANQFRGLLAEFGIVVPKGVATLKHRWLQIRTQHAEQIPPLALEEFDGLYRRLLGLHQTILAYDRKMRLGRISKRGDPYLRTLLIHGARTGLMHTPNQQDRKSLWAEQLKHDKPWNKVAVALANKHARIAWAMLANNTSYQPT